MAQRFILTAKPPLSHVRRMAVSRRVSIVEYDGASAIVSTVEIRGDGSAAIAATFRVPRLFAPLVVYWRKHATVARETLGPLSYCDATVPDTRGPYAGRHMLPVPKHSQRSKWHPIGRFQGTRDSGAMHARNAEHRLAPGF